MNSSPTRGTGSSGKPHWRRRLYCITFGHQKAWGDNIFGPRWTCSHCGDTGGLEEHSRMSLIQLLGYIGPGLLVALIAWMVIQWIW